MSEIKVKNYGTVAADRISENGNEFSIKPVISLKEAKRCAVHFVEVEPNNHAFGYHWHEMNEEVFYIIKGKGIIRTIDGDINVGEGDVITFPAGKKGSHCIRNASQTEKLIYIDFDAINIPDIVHLPDIKKIMYTGPFSNGMFDEQ